MAEKGEHVQLIIKIHLDVPLVLPLAYHYIIQSALYDLMKEPDRKDSYYHDRGHNYGKRIYRMFTFGLLHGQYRIKNGNIAFYDMVELEVRSQDMHLIYLLYENIVSYGIRFGKDIYHEVELCRFNRSLETDCVNIKMDSPICVYQTDKECKKTFYLEPSDIKFSEYVNENFKRKYAAAYGNMPDTAIKLEVVNCKPEDKYVTRYKGIYISGWKGMYRLYGKRKYLDFLYNTGLGSKNSQGFGMFNVINVEDIQS